MHAKTNGLLAEPGQNGAKTNGNAEAADVESQQVVQGSTHGMVLPFMQVTVSFRDVRYFVPIPEVRQGLPAPSNYTNSTPQRAELSSVMSACGMHANHAMQSAKQG